MPNLSQQQLVPIIRECKQLQGGWLQKIQQPFPDLLILQIREKQTFRLLISTQTHFLRCHITQEKFSNPPQPLAFCQVLRKHLENTKLIALDIAKDDRIISLTLTQKQEENIEVYYLIAELWAGKSNIYLLDASKQILALLDSKSDKSPGETYQEWPATEDYQNFEDEQPGFLQEFLFPTAENNWRWNQAAQKFYQQALAEESKQRLLQHMQRKLRREAKRTKSKLTKLEKSWEESQKTEEFRKYGELLKSQQHLIKRGQSQAQLVDYFDPNTPQITIPLNPEWDAKENMESYFKKYRKLQKSRPRLEEEIKNLNKQLTKIHNKQTTLDEFDDSYQALESLARKWQIPLTKEKKSPTTTPPTKQEYRTFHSYDGWEILVARGARENEQLTFSIAKGNDLWLHVENYPGSHVVIRSKKKQEIPPETLLDAAHLAVHFSKAKDHQQAEVMYTPCKHVSRQKGGKPGQVLLANKKNLLLKKEQERLQRLLQEGKK